MSELQSEFDAAKRIRDTAMDEYYFRLAALFPVGAVLRRADWQQQCVEVEILEGGYTYEAGLRRVRDVGTDEKYWINVEAFSWERIAR